MAVPSSLRASRRALHRHTVRASLFFEGLAPAYFCVRDQRRIALGDCFFCAAVIAAFVDCGCAAVSAPCSIGCTFMGPVAGGRSLAIPDNARGWHLVSFLLPFLVR